jgi:dihydrofolate synthase/folylpolyglutamate synthase
VELALSAYQRALDFLFARTGSTMKAGLARTEALLAAVGRPHDRFPVFHVAGTNGKGSTCATLEALLRAKGLRVGKYTSPHLVDFRERITVDGEPVEADRVVRFVRDWTGACERLGATFFEATTALAFDTFADSAVDVAVVEVGLGGRLDSTNVVRPVAAGVTSIGMDHAEWLGPTLELIAREKGGIYKAGVPAVVGELDPALCAQLVEQAHAAGASAVRVLRDEFTSVATAVDDVGTAFDVGWRGERLRLRTPLPGRHQAQNTLTALLMLDAAGGRYATTLAEAAGALGAVRLAGRFQRRGRHLFDVAHNPAGALVLAETLAASGAARPVRALFGVLGDKDWREMMRTLAPVVDHFVLATPPSAPADRAWRLEESLAFAREHGWSAEAAAEFGAALATAERGAGTVLVTGSFHTVGDAMALLQLSPTSA